MNKIIGLSKYFVVTKEKTVVSDGLRKEIIAICKAELPEDIFLTEIEYCDT